jgi:hypothetical protein
MNADYAVKSSENISENKKKKKIITKISTRTQIGRLSPFEIKK